MASKNRKPDLAGLVYGKVPPQAPDLEKAVLGAILMEPNLIDVVTEILRTPDCFYIDTHQKVYESMQSLVTKGMPVDILTVAAEMEQNGALELVGGKYALMELSQAVLSTAHVHGHALIIKEKHIAREMIKLGGDLVSMGYDSSTDPFELMEHADKGIFSINNSLVKKDYVSAAKVVKTVMSQDEELINMPQGLVGVPTGNSDLDEITGGWRPGKLIIIAARPSVGKTAYALNVAHNAALGNKRPVGFFSLEMENDELVRRLVSIDAKIDTYKVDYPKTRTPEEEAAIQRSYQRIAASKLYFDDTPGLSIGELTAKARRMKNKHGIEILFIDYLQLMQGDSKSSMYREAEISKISRDLKGLAKELRIPIIALCQLNREIEKSTTNEFKLSHLRESGGIEQDADVIGFLWRPDKKDIEKDPSLKGIGKLEIAKHRGGIKKKILYYADMSTQTWSGYQEFKSGGVKQVPLGYQDTSKNTPVYNAGPGAIDDLPF